MSSGCGDVLSLEGMKTIKLHQTFEAEVITGREGGVASGGEIDTATNAVTAQVQKTLPAILRDIGFDRASFDFSAGGTLGIADRNKIVYNPADNNWYSWSGVLPKIVSAGEDPTADANWKPRTDQLLRQDLISTATGLGSSLVSAPAGGTLAQTVLFITPEQNGAVGDGVTDDSDAVQAAINKAAARSVTANSIYLPQFVVLSRVYKITKTLTIDGSKVRMAALGGGGFYFDPTGTYTSSRCIVVTGTSTNAAYVGQTGALFDGVSFVSSGNSLDLFYVVHNSSVGGNNGACLHNIDNISVRGFSRVYTHGSGGWGWTFKGCQFSGNTNLMNIVTASDTYERHSFFGCTWQNGGYAFIMNNPNGKIYWHGGSIDYCDGLANISNGHLEANGHNEWTARSMPLVVITGSNASVAVSGTMFVRNNTSTLYYIFQQFQRRQVSLRDVTFITDGTNVSLGVISNLEVVKHNLTFPNDSAKGIAYHSSDENLINTTTLNADYSLSVTANHTVSVSGGVLTVTATAGGTASHLYIDIPVVGMSRVAFKVIASNTSSAGAIFLNKYLLTLNKTQIADLSSSGTTSWAASASSVGGGSVTVFDIPKQAGYLRLDFNVVKLTTGTSFIIESLKTFTY